VNGGFRAPLAGLAGWVSDYSRQVLRLHFLASASLRAYAPELCDRILAQRQEQKRAAKEML
jgi:hypothetical protein